jgi:hypothetical protein
MLLGDFNAKVGREDIFKPTIVNESLHETSNYNGVRVVNFATSKNLTVKSTMFPHRNIHKVTWTSPDGTHQLLVYADDVNVLGDNIDTTKKNTRTLIDDSKEIGLEVNAEKTNYIVVCIRP